MRLFTYCQTKAYLLSILLFIILSIIPLLRLRADYFTTSDGVKLYYNSRGEGPALILIHDLLANSNFWEENVKELKYYFQVITVDMRGHGFTMEAESGDYRVARMARDLQELIEELELEEVTLLGWAAGAYIVYSYLELHGIERIDSIVVIDMPPTLINDSSWNMGRYNDEQLRETIDAIYEDDYALRDSLVPSIFALEKTISPEEYDFVRKNYMLTPREALVTILLELAASDYRPLIFNMPVPILYLYGEKSALYSKELATWMADNLPFYLQKEIVPFAESGNAPHLEEPERFYKVINEFINEEELIF